MAQNHSRFKTWREALSAFCDERIDQDPMLQAAPHWILDHAMLEWLYEEVDDGND